MPCFIPYDSGMASIHLAIAEHMNLSISEDSLVIDDAYDLAFERLLASGTPLPICFLEVNGIFGPACTAHNLATFMDFVSLRRIEN